MALLNITGTQTNLDPHFRYTMPALSIRHEGRGNGQKTVLLNLKDVSDAFDHPLELLVRYIGIELSAQCRQESDSSRVIVNGHYLPDQLAHVVNTYIDLFVLCPKCRLPETHLGIRKDRVRHKCKSCGAKEVIESDHKLVKYIVKLFSGAK